MHAIEKQMKYEIKIKKSLFIGYLKHVNDAEAARNFIREIKKLHKQANHNCSAYIVGNICFSSDDREPRGSAGRPILNMLRRYEMTNVVLVVTRYFGGVELGIRGLIEAYGKVAEETIRAIEKDLS